MFVTPIILIRHCEKHGSICPSGLTVTKIAACTVAFLQSNVLHATPGVTLPFLSSSSLQSWFVLMSTKKILNGTKIKRNPKTKHCYDSGFLPLFISVQFPNCNILLFFFPSVFFFCFLDTQDTAMHNSKFKKSIASTTIKNSLSKTSFPLHSFVLFQRWGKAC